MAGYIVMRRRLIVVSPHSRDSRWHSFRWEPRNAIPVAWTFISEIFAKHRRIVERL